MTNLTPLFFINIDKLSFNFNNKFIQFIDSDSFRFELLSKPRNRFYDTTILVYHNDKPFGHISHENLRDKYNSQFSLVNRQLYIQGFSDIIIQLFNYLNIVYYSLAIFENSINTNINLVSKFYSYFRTDERIKLLDIKEGYYDMSITNCRNRVRNTNLHHDTVILKRTGKAIETRIENKTNEVQVKILQGKGNKQYVLDSYSTVLDITKDVYRVEQIINFKKLRKETHRHCYVKLGNPFIAISKTDYNKLTLYRKGQYKLVDSQLPKSFDLSLLEDRDFLFSFFAEYSIFDYTRILGKVKPQLLTIHNLRPMHITKCKTTSMIYFENGKCVTKSKTLSKDIFDIEPFDLYSDVVIVKKKKVISLDEFFE